MYYMTDLLGFIRMHGGLFVWSLNIFLFNLYFSRKSILGNQVLNNELASLELTLSHCLKTCLGQSALKLFRVAVVVIVFPEPPAIRRSERYINSVL